MSFDDFGHYFDSITQDFETPGKTFIIRHDFDDNMLNLILKDTILIPPFMILLIPYKF